MDPFDPTEEISFTRMFAEAGVNSEMAETVCRLMKHRLTVIAKSRKRKLTIGDSLATTELVDDAVMRLLRVDGERWNDRTHILSTAAKAMEQIALNHLKKNRTRGVAISSLSNSDPVDRKTLKNEGVGAVHSAIARLEEVDPRLATIVRLHDFARMTFVEIAKEVDLSERTVRTLYREALERLRKDLEDELQ